LKQDPSKDVIEGLSGIFADYVKPAGAIHRELLSDRWTLQMTWFGFQVFADVTPVVNEVIYSGKISAGGFFKEIIDDLIGKFATEIVQRNEKMEKKEAKVALKQSKILRLQK
jgi:hypothetical protein